MKKLLLTFYAFIVLILTFGYAPIVCHYQDGIKEYKGHHIRERASKLTFQNGFRSERFCTIDSFLLFNEILVITLVTGTICLCFRREHD